MSLLYPKTHSLLSFLNDRDIRQNIRTDDTVIDKESFFIIDQSVVIL